MHSGATRPTEGPQPTSPTSRPAPELARPSNANRQATRKKEVVTGQALSWTLPNTNTYYPNNKQLVYDSSLRRPTHKKKKKSKEPGQGKKTTNKDDR